MEKLMITKMASEFIGPEVVAERIPGMSTANLAQLRFKGVGPKFMKPSPRVVVYDWVDVIEWLESTKREGTSNAE